MSKYPLEYIVVGVDRLRISSVTFDLDIYRAAKLVIDRHNDEAAVVSRLCRTLVGGVLRLSDQGVTLLEQFHVQIPVGRPPRGGDVT